MRLRMYIAFIIVLAPYTMSLPEVNAAAPTLVGQFKSSTGRTVIEYYTYSIGPCAGPNCSFSGSIMVPAGFDQVEVFLSGFELKAAAQPDAVSQVSVRVAKKRYESSSGELEVNVGAGLSTRSSQKYSYSISFVVVLTGSSVAKFTPVQSGCEGVGRCTIKKTLPLAIPTSMQYIGLATQTWFLGSQSGPLVLNTLSAHRDGMTVKPPLLGLEYLCSMQGKMIKRKEKKNRMFCEWVAKVIAFDVTEMEPDGHFPHNTFFTSSTNVRHFWTNHLINSSRKPITGFFDAFEGLTLTYQPFGSTAPSAHNLIWAVEASAENFRIDPGAPDTALTDYGIGLGVQFGIHTPTELYGYQVSRAFGFLQ